MSDPDQGNILAEQKKNCPFCKIIKGDIPSKKIYESDFVLAILDINPATKGHMLVMPKEHYPILPLIPESVFSEMFLVATKVGDIAKIVFMKQGSTFFVANGGVAGQQSSHFMMHVIPRDTSEVLKLNITKKAGDLGKIESLQKTLKHNLSIMLKKRYEKFPLKDREGRIISMNTGYTKESVIAIIEKNPQLKDAIVAEPFEFKKIIPSNKQLSEIFKNVDVDEVIKHYVPSFDPYKKEDHKKKEEIFKTQEADNTNNEEQPPEPKSAKEVKEELKSEEKKKKEYQEKKKDDNSPDLDLISKLF